MAKRNAKKQQMKVINELLSQVILKAERWGKTGYYTPLRLEEMYIDAINQLSGELLTEKANLEYELHALGTNKQDAVIKIERLNSYIQKAKHLKARTLKKIEDLLGKKIGDKDKLALAVARIRRENKPSVSVMINSN